MQTSAKLSFLQADECLTTAALYGARTGLDALEATLGIKPRTVEVPVGAADFAAARLKVAKHLMAPDAAAPFDLLQRVHNRMETSTLLGQAIAPGRHRLSAFAAHARSHLDVPFAAIDGLTLRSLYKNQAADAWAPWRTWAAPITVPLWLASQAAACAGALVKGVLLVAATAVRIGVFIGSCVVRGMPKTIDGLTAFVVQQAVVQTFSATMASKNKGATAHVCEEIELILDRGHELLSSMAQRYRKDALESGSNEQELKSFDAMSAHVATAWQTLSRKIVQRKMDDPEGIYADCVKALPVDALMGLARTVLSVLTDTADSRHTVSSTQLVAARRALGAAMAVLEDNAELMTQLAEDIDLGPQLQAASNEGRALAKGLTAALEQKRSKG